MLKRMLIFMLLLSAWVAMPIQSEGATIISNGVRNFIADQTGSRTSSYVLQNDKHTDHEAAVAEGISAGVGTAATIGASTAGAAAAGAGSLAGYAGIASAVASIPGGSAITGALGSLIAGHSVAGAAATAACTTFVGGPVVMGGILIGGTAAVGYGIYRGGKYLLDTDAGRWASHQKDKAMNWVKSLW